MIVALRIKGPMREWHRRLVEQLEAEGHAVATEALPGGTAARVGFVLAAERWLYRSRSALYAPIDTPRPRHDLGEPDIRLDLTGAPPAGAACVEPLFDGERGEAALARALLAGRAPIIRVQAGNIVQSAGLPAVEDPLRLSRALDDVLVRLATLLAAAVPAAVQRLPAVNVPEALGPPPNPVWPPAFLARGCLGKVSRRFGSARGRPDHWRIAYRRVLGEGVAETPAWPMSDFVPLADDGRRFYADPFPFEDGGRVFVFFEDFPYATSKGVIGVVELDVDGQPSPPRVVLEAPVHLSYPFLIRDGGEVFMVPEMSSAGRIQLFRADPFPDCWVPDAILIEGVVASDATIVRHEDRYWLFAALSDGGGSTWDQLGLFHAPSLRGPWTAHAKNPVLIDAGCARPAGAMWHEGGHLMRIAQDCRAGYGAGLAICRVERLDTDVFAQTVVCRLGPPSGFGAVGTHTLNRCGDLEVIDLRVPHSSSTTMPV